MVTKCHSVGKENVVRDFKKTSEERRCERMPLVVGNQRVRGHF